jgi:hypothetical protein
MPVILGNRYPLLLGILHPMLTNPLFVDSVYGHPIILPILIRSFPHSPLPPSLGAFCLSSVTTSAWLTRGQSSLFGNFLFLQNRCHLRIRGGVSLVVRHGPLLCDQTATDPPQYSGDAQPPCVNFEPNVQIVNGFGRQLQVRLHHGRVNGVLGLHLPRPRLKPPERGVKQAGEQGNRAADEQEVDDGACPFHDIVLPFEDDGFRVGVRSADWIWVMERYMT